MRRPFYLEIVFDSCLIPSSTVYDSSTVCCSMQLWDMTVVELESLRKTGRILCQHSRRIPISPGYTDPQRAASNRLLDMLQNHCIDYERNASLKFHQNPSWGRYFLKWKCWSHLGGGTKFLTVTSPTRHEADFGSGVTIWWKKLGNADWPSDYSFQRLISILYCMSHYLHNHFGNFYVTLPPVSNHL